MRLFLIRHGETPWNRRQRCQGVTDVPLSATGRAQAASLAAALADEPLVAVYSSPLARAAETARAVAAPHGLAVVGHPGLRELDHGACEGLTPRELAVRFGDILAAWRRAPADVLLPGGESMRQAARRATAAIEEIAARHGDRDAVAVVSHNLVILALLSRALGWPLDRFRELRQDTAGVSVLHVTPAGEARVERVNETAHLGYLARPTAPAGAGAEGPSPADPPRLFADLDAPFSYLVLQGLAAREAPKLGWRGLVGTPVASTWASRAAARLAARVGVPLVGPPPAGDLRPALRLLADAEAHAGLGVRLAARLADLRFRQGRDLADRRLLVEAAVAAGLPAERALAVLDRATPLGAAAEARVEADQAEAAARRIPGVPAAVGGGRVRIGLALLALSRRLVRPVRAVAVRGAALVAAGLVGAGCGGQGLFAGLTPTQPVSVVSSDALLETPITRVAVTDLEARDGSPADGAFLAAAIREVLQGRPGLSVATAKEVEEAAAATASDVERPDAWPPARIRRLADILGADAVITGRIVRFVDRVGSAAAAREPASVELLVEMSRGADGALLWRGTFDYTQRALSENLADVGLFFRGGVRWLTARELARLGIESLLQELPVPRGPGAPATVPGGAR